MVDWSKRTVAPLGPTSGAFSTLLNQIVFPAVIGMPLKFALIELLCRQLASVVVVVGAAVVDVVVVVGLVVEDVEVGVVVVVGDVVVVGGTVVVVVVGAAVVVVLVVDVVVVGGAGGARVGRHGAARPSIAAAGVAGIRGARDRGADALPAPVAGVVVGAGGAVVAGRRVVHVLAACHRIAGVVGAGVPVVAVWRRHGLDALMVHAACYAVADVPGTALAVLIVHAAVRN